MSPMPAISMSGTSFCKGSSLHPAHAIDASAHPNVMCHARIDNLGREVLLGLRPEDVEARPGGSDAVLGGRVTSVLPVGSDQFLGLDIEGMPVYVRVPKDRHHRPGDLVSFCANTPRLQLFDPQTRVSLLWGAGA